jgi:UDP-N-acetylmuramoyl-tripeptide--D-alanyl-D-alanine ligase
MGAVALTAGLVASATGGRLVSGAPSQAFNGVSIDSRTLVQGTLFVALRGERFDGHDFVGAALDRGATGLLVSRPPAPADRGAVILVGDTLEALQRLGREVRRQSGARVVAITGSTGKTTTKEIAADLLSSRYRVFRNAGNLNNHIGLPLSLTELHRGAEVAVVELGMNHAGEIRTLVGIAEPDVRVWTNVGDAHIGYFGSREAVAAAKAEILEAATPDAVLVANADDPLVMAHARRFTGRLVTFGEDARATVRATQVVDRGFDGTTARVLTPSGELQLEVRLAGRGQLANVLAGAAVALHFGVPPATIEARVPALRPVPRRAESTALDWGVRLVDDSYNASPAAVRMMLAALAATATSGRRIAVLGEMHELGPASRALHQACGQAAAAAGVDELIVVGGPDADGLADGANAGGLPRSRVHRFADSRAAAAAVTHLVKRGDVVLVKGSRATRLDVIADRLKQPGTGA